MREICTYGLMRGRTCPMRGVSLGAYAAYYDYLFDSHARNSAKAYEATGSHTDSFSFVMGVSLAVAF